MKIKFDTFKMVNLTTQKEFTLSDDPVMAQNYVLETIDLGQAPASTSYVGWVDQLGSDITNIALEVRPIQLVGYVLGDDAEAIRRNRQMLNKFFNPFQIIRGVIYDEYYMDFKPSSSIQYSTGYDENNEVMCKFLVQGEAALPLFAKLEKTVIDQSPAYPVKVFAMQIPIDEGIIFGEVGSGYQRKIDNTGDVPAGFSCRITPSSIPIENPRINITYPTGGTQFMEYKLTLQLGQTLVVSTYYGQESAVVVDSSGKEILNANLYMTRESDPFLLEQGENIMVVSDVTGPLEIVGFVIEFSPLYLEVI